ncbi:ZZ-type zinc finger-containing protein 3 [Stylophora pistillata]|uniref:ZZ-type zinc finger-containing protein 3 n=1 Tax=Stylophora pistillata TaxID=50429 RepID=A0A2B4SBH9_STYPI|nr:ZZ-type zinc finger-containing protein 3 [Stylophora pistillata]
MKSNELNRTEEVDNHGLPSTVARFGDVIKNNCLMENEIKTAETAVKIINEDGEVDLDVTAFGCKDDDQACGLSLNESKDLNEDRIPVIDPCEVVEDVDVGFNDHSREEVSGSQSSMVDHDKLETICRKTFDERVLQLHCEISDNKTSNGVHGLEKESPAKETSKWREQLLNDAEENDNYNRFYFESDHLALKDNKHYHLLLQTLLMLESQRSQAVKDLDNLYEQQVKALQDPVSFVEKLQNKQHLDLPPRQKIVKLPSVPWEEYTVSLSAIERQRLSNPHLTRATSNNLGKAAESSLQSSDASETLCTAPSESNVYSVFGGGFVASRQGKTLERESLTSVFTPRGSELKNGQNDMKPVTFNQPWTTEEQAKLEKLLQIYPQEEIESKRWEKIAAALGNRTYKQVASRVQKYFIKLAKAGLPIPGRVPNIPRLGTRSKRSSHHYQTLGFRNSTFFPSYRPKVLMEEDDEISSVATDDTVGYASDEETVPVDQRNTEEYRELVGLKRLKRQRLKEYQRSEMSVQHHGFMCDGCGMNPISGTRWHCTDCSKDASVDFCSECAERNVNVGVHTSEHHLEPVDCSSTFFVDGDYLGLSRGSTSVGYNYLDPNFLPSTTS